MDQHGLLIPIEIAISSQDSGMRHAGAAALCSIATLDVSLVRSYVLSQQAPINSDTGNNERNLLRCIINRFTSAIDPDLMYQYGDILKMILELVDIPRASSKHDRKVKKLKTTKGMKDPVLKSVYI
jgi:hypothetical protein